MNTKSPYIHIFKTNVRFKKDIQKVTPLLNEITDVLSWNIDLADIDKVLRVESSAADTNPVITTLKAAGYHCEEYLN